MRGLTDEEREILRQTIGQAPNDQLTIDLQVIIDRLIARGLIAVVGDDGIELSIGCTPLGILALRADAAVMGNTILRGT